jgi:hypothetical protein
MNALCDLWAVNGTVINGVLSKEKKIKINKKKGEKKKKERQPLRPPRISKTNS